MLFSILLHPLPLHAFISNYHDYHHWKIMLFSDRLCRSTKALLGRASEVRIALECYRFDPYWAFRTVFTCSNFHLKRDFGKKIMYRSNFISCRHLFIKFNPCVNYQNDYQIIRMIIRLSEWLSSIRSQKWRRSLNISDDNNCCIMCFGSCFYLFNHCACVASA